MKIISAGIQNYLYSWNRIFFLLLYSGLEKKCSVRNQNKRRIFQRPLFPNYLKRKPLRNKREFLVYYLNSRKSRFRSLLTFSQASKFAIS